MAYRAHVTHLTFYFFFQWEGLKNETRRNSQILTVTQTVYVQTAIAPSWLQWLVFFVAGASAVGAFYSVYLVRKTARQRATVDFINNYNADARIDAAFAFLRNLPADGGVPPGFDGSEDRQKFLFLMNQFEILAIGLKRKIYDKKMVIDTFGRDLRQIYENSSPLINHIRAKDKDPDAFSEFEALAEKFISRHDIK